VSRLRDPRQLETVRTLVFDANIRKMHVPVDERQVALPSPFGDFAIERVPVALIAAPFTVHLTQEALVVPLQLIIQDHPPDLRAAVGKALGRIHVGLTELGIVRQLSGFSRPA
jgi:hypothetical protein